MSRSVKRTISPGGWTGLRTATADTTTKLVTPGARLPRAAQGARYRPGRTGSPTGGSTSLAKAEAEGVKVWSKADFRRDDFALSRGTWYQVQRVNAKSITVMWGTNTGQLPAVTRDNVRHALGPSTHTGTISYDEDART